MRHTFPKAVVFLFLLLSISSCKTQQKSNLDAMTLSAPEAAISSVDDSNVNWPESITAGLHRKLDEVDDKEDFQDNLDELYSQLEDNDFKPGLYSFEDSSLAVTQHGDYREISYARITTERVGSGSRGGIEIYATVYVHASAGLNLANSEVRNALTLSSELQKGVLIQEDPTKVQHGKKRFIMTATIVAIVAAAVAEASFIAVKLPHLPSGHDLHKQMEAKLKEKIGSSLPSIAKRKKYSCSHMSSVGDFVVINKICREAASDSLFKSCVTQCVVEFLEKEAKAAAKHLKFDASVPVGFADEIREWAQQRKLAIDDRVKIWQGLINFSESMKGETLKAFKDAYDTATSDNKKKTSSIIHRSRSKFRVKMYEGKVYRFDTREPQEVIRAGGMMPNPKRSNNYVDIFFHIQPFSIGSRCYMSATWAPEPNKDLPQSIWSKEHSYQFSCQATSGCTISKYTNLKRNFLTSTKLSSMIIVNHSYEYYKSNAMGVRVLAGGVDGENEVVTAGFRPERFRVVGFYDSEGEPDLFLKSSELPIDQWPRVGVLR